MYIIYKCSVRYWELFSVVRFFLDSYRNKDFCFFFKSNDESGLGSRMSFFFDHVVVVVVCLSEGF